MKRRWVLIVLPVVIPQILYWPIVYPRHARRMTSLENEISERDKRIEMTRAAERKLPEFRQEVRRLQQEHEKLDLILPPTLSGDDLWSAVESTAELTGVRIQRVDLRSLEDRGTHSMLPAEVEVTGSADQLLDFFRAVASYRLIIFVSDVTVERVGPMEWRAMLLLKIAADQVSSKQS